MFGALTFLTLLFISGQHALACPSLASLEDENGNCSTNGTYVDAGISCFTDFEKQVKRESGEAFAEMKASNKKFVMGDKNSQASGLAGANADFKLSEAKLNLLIAAGKVALKNIESYSRNIYFPEEWDAPEELIGNGLDYLNASACYAEPRDILNDMSERAAQYIQDLENAKAGVVSMRGTTTRREEKIDNISPTRKLSSSTSAQGAGYKNKKSVLKKSTVTGVDEDKKKSRLPPR